MINIVNDVKLVENFQQIYHYLVSPFINYFFKHFSVYRVERLKFVSKFKALAAFVLESS